MVILRRLSDPNREFIRRGSGREEGSEVPTHLQEDRNGFHRRCLGRLIFHKNNKVFCLLSIVDKARRSCRCRPLHSRSGYRQVAAAFRCSGPECFGDGGMRIQCLERIKLETAQQEARCCTFPAWGTRAMRGRRDWTEGRRLNRSRPNGVGALTTVGHSARRFGLGCIVLHRGRRLHQFGGSRLGPLACAQKEQRGVRIRLTPQIGMLDDPGGKRIDAGRALIHRLGT